MKIEVFCSSLVISNDKTCRFTFSQEEGASHANLVNRHGPPVLEIQTKDKDSFVPGRSYVLEITDAEKT